MKDNELVAEVFKRADDYFEKQKRLCALTELEKIKAEILSEYPYAESDKARLIGYGIHIALEFIDKHISELKGEKQ